MIRNLYYFLFCMIMFCSAACERERAVEIAIYDWEATVVWSQERTRYLNAIHVNQIYLKILETDGLNIIRTRLREQQPADIEIVPVMRLNETYFDNQTISIAEQSILLIDEIQKMEEMYKIHFTNEVQFDFDYTAMNRESYFELVRSVEQQSRKKVSITLNLDKLEDKKHLPPVSYCMLMLYDFPSREAGIPHVFDMQKLNAYAQSVSSYPLSLHFSIATFSRSFVKRNSEVFQVLNVDFEELKNDSHLLFSGDGKYEVIQSFMFQGQYLQKGDIFYADELAISRVKEAIRFIKSNTKSKDVQIVFFSLNNSMLKRFSAVEINESTALLK